MSRDYRLIKNGKFTGDSVFSMNVSGYMFMGRVLDLLGLPCSRTPLDKIDDHPSAPHEITGETQWKICSFLCQEPLPRKDIIAAVILANEEQGFHNPSTAADVEWVLAFLNLAKNPEGFASDYCAEYFQGDD